MKATLVFATLLVSSPALAEIGNTPAEMPAAPAQITLPTNTLVEVTPAQEITSKEMREGTTRQFLVARDVVERGVVMIPRGAPVTAEVTWRTGKGIVGKSAKFELTFKSVRVGGSERLLRGTHRQEGRGNTVGALLGSMIITGRSASMSPGQIVNVFTAEDITAFARTEVPAPMPAVHYSVESRPAPAANATPNDFGNRKVHCSTCR